MTFTLISMAHDDGDDDKDDDVDDYLKSTNRKLS